VLADTIPIYPLYALLFVDAGLSGAQISTLFLVWSAVGIVAEIPSGALADRFSRPAALVASGVLQAAGYALWIAAPGYLAFAAGFVLWGINNTSWFQTKVGQESSLGVPAPAAPTPVVVVLPGPPGLGGA